MLIEHQALEISLAKEKTVLLDSIEIGDSVVLCLMSTIKALKIDKEKNILLVRLN